MTRPNPCMAQFCRCFSTKRSSASFDPGNTNRKVLLAARETNGSHYVNRALDLDLKIFPLFEKCFSSIYDNHNGAFASTTKCGEEEPGSERKLFFVPFFHPAKALMSMTQTPRTPTYRVALIPPQAHERCGFY